MSDSINIKEYIVMFKKRKKLVFLILIISLILGINIEYKRNKSYIPTYQTSTRVRINTEKSTGTGSLGSISMNQSISNTYLSLAKSKKSLEEIKATLGLEISIGELSSKINIYADENNPEFINITVTDIYPQRATDIANTVPTAFNNELKRTINVDCVQVIDPALDSTSPLPQVKSKFAVKMVGIGIVISIFIVLLLEFLGNKIITTKDVEQYWGVQLLGVLPYEKTENKKKLKKETGLEVQ